MWRSPRALLWVATARNPPRCTPVREGRGGRCRVAAGRATVAGGRPQGLDRRTETVTRAGCGVRWYWWRLAWHADLASDRAARSNPRLRTLLFRACCSRRPKSTTVLSTVGTSTRRRRAAWCTLSGAWMGRRWTAPRSCLPRGARSDTALGASRRSCLLGDPLAATARGARSSSTGLS